MFGFVNWDDPTNITDNPQLLLDRPGRLLSFWTAPFADLYVPLVYSSFLFDLALSGGSDQLFATRLPAAPVFHATNLLCHWAAGCGVFLLLRQLLVGPPILPLLAATFFLVHPLQAEPVSWVTGRKDVLSGALCLLSLATWRAWLQAGHRWRYMLSTLLFGAGLLSKPSAVVLPFMAAALAWHAEVPWRRWSPWLLPWLFAALAAVVVTRLAQAGATGGEFVYPFGHRLLVMCDTILFYAGKLLWPTGLVPLYHRTNAVLFSGWWIWLEPFVLLLLLAGAIRLERGARLVALLFVIPLIPVSGIVPFFYQLLSNVADRYAYLSLAGAAVGAGLLLRYAAGRWPQHRRTSLLVGSALVLVLGALCFWQVGYWSNSGTLWARQLAIKPHSTMGRYLLARYHWESDNVLLARQQYEATTKSDPQFADSYNDLMALADQIEDNDLLTSTARRALANLPPTTQEKHVTRGRAYLALQDYPAAATSFRSALAVLPDDPEAQRNLALSLLRQNDFKGAVQEGERAIALDPRSEQAHDIVAVALLKGGRPREAAGMMRRLVEMAPENPSYRQKLATMEKAAAAGTPSP